MPGESTELRSTFCSMLVYTDVVAFITHWMDEQYRYINAFLCSNHTKSHCLSMCNDGVHKTILLISV